MNEDQVISKEQLEAELNKSNGEKDNNQNKEKKKSSFVKYILNIVFVLLVTAVTVGITIATNKGIFDAFKNIQWQWIFAALGLVVLAFVLRSIIYFCFARLYTRKYHIHQAMALDQIGVFYSAVTPGASGGQFMQAYTYKKQGLPISAGASIMVMASIVYQSMLILYGVLSICIRWDILAGIKPFEISFGGNVVFIPIIPLIVAGFIVNMAVIGILFLMSYWKGFHHFMCGPMITFLSYLHIVKDKDRASESLRIQVENFKIELRRLLSNIPFTILISILFFLVLTCMFAVPCFVGKALGATFDITFSTVWETIFMSNFHQMVTGLIPLPGSAGVSELFFFQLFDPLYQTETGISITAASQLIWRTITFTLPLLIGGIVAAFYKASPKEEVGHRDLNLHTFVALQHETYIERERTMQETMVTAALTRQAIIKSLKLRDKADREVRKRNKEEAKAKAQDEARLRKIDESEWKEMNIGDDDEDL